MRTESLLSTTPSVHPLRKVVWRWRLHIYAGGRCGLEDFVIPGGALSSCSPCALIDREQKETVDERWNSEKNRPFVPLRLDHGPVAFGRVEVQAGLELDGHRVGEYFSGA